MMIVGVMRINIVGGNNEDDSGGDDDSGVMI